MTLEEFKYFFPERPRLLHIDQDLFQKLSDDPMWVAEPKYNEIRLELHCVRGNFEFWDRHGKQLSYEPTQEVMDALAKLPLEDAYYLFDGGLRHNKVVGIKNRIVLYDCYVWKGEMLLGKAFWYRRSLLMRVVEATNGSEPVISLPPQHRNDFRSVFDEVIKDPEMEGLVIKNTQGMIELGRKGPVDSSWMWKVRKPSGRYQF